MLNLKRYRKEKGLTLKQLGNIIGVSESAVGQYENGKRKPNFEMLLKISEALDCTVNDLVYTSSPSINTPPTVTGNYVTYNIIGEVAAGYDHIAYEDWENGKVDIPVSWLSGNPADSFFVLRVIGDSMFPTYQDGDLVLVLKQNLLDYSGQICVVQYDDEIGTIKRVEYNKSAGWLRLSPVNPQYAPITKRGEELTHCNILGIPKYLIRQIIE